MTERQSVEELRRWSAEFMGWIWSEEWQMWHLATEEAMRTPDELPLIGDNPDDQEQTLWLPDRPESGQIWQVVKKMQEKNYFLQFEDEGLKTGEFFANYGFQGVLSRNPCLAILKAAWAACRVGHEDAKGDR